ncbi:hypothetical protein L6452_33565 [Arctium lappa]|uniref:Uncharacterized protein n=1 Tax=Arctium lappa TaxID=4217 RepID=A0ACB8YGE6_ARCLA|nr:hypothetical protein L6452_33565 [Arctium lappa]
MKIGDHRTNSNFTEIEHLGLYGIGHSPPYAAVLNGVSGAEIALFFSLGAVGASCDGSGGSCYRPMYIFFHIVV